MTAWDREVQRLVEHGRDREAAALAVRHLSLSGGDMDPLDQFDALGPVLGGVVAGIGPESLDAPTPCADLTVRGVLEHMIGGATVFAAAFRGDPAPPAPSFADPVAAVGSALGSLGDAVHAPGALDRTIAAPFGDVPGAAFAGFVVLDGLVHGWDLATATGRPYAPPEGLVAAVDAYARSAITPSLRSNGMFAPPVPAPPGATPIERLVSFTGRSVR
jgi:uncharacterized protein (TIGR03086 family)